MLPLIFYAQLEIKKEDTDLRTWMISYFWRDLIFRPLLKGQKIKVGPWPLFREGYQVRRGMRVVKCKFQQTIMRWHSNFHFKD